MRSRLEFATRPYRYADGPARDGVVPVIDGQPLDEWVSIFERRQGYRPAGGYAPLLLGPTQKADPAAYYLGREPAYGLARGTVWLLGCACGEAGCWPLEVQVIVDDRWVSWVGFAQPHRPERDYDGFSRRFRFARADYEAAAAALRH